MDKRYFLGILSELNYRIATHEGNSKRRLGEYAITIFRISNEVIPKIYQKEFNQLIDLVSIENKSNPIGMGITFENKRNSTIVKYIKLLLDIESHIRCEIEEEKK